MGGTAVGVVDTSVLLNLATPVVDGRSNAPTGADPLKAVLTTYDVHVPASVLGETSEAAADDDLLATAAELVLNAAHQLTTHDANADIDGTFAYGLDRGESQGFWLANELAADLFVTDEFKGPSLSVRRIPVFRVRLSDTFDRCSTGDTGQSLTQGTPNLEDRQKLRTTALAVIYLG